MGNQKRPPTDIGKAVRQLRVAKGVSQGALAASAGVGVLTVKGLELGYDEQRNPKLSTLRQLARALGVSLDRLLCGEVRS